MMSRFIRLLSHPNMGWIAAIVMAGLVTVLPMQMGSTTWYAAAGAILVTVVTTWVRYYKRSRQEEYDAYEQEVALVCSLLDELDPAIRILYRNFCDRYGLTPNCVHYIHWKEQYAATVRDNCNNPRRASVYWRSLADSGKLPLMDHAHYDPKCDKTTRHISATLGTL